MTAGYHDPGVCAQVVSRKIQNRCRNHADVNNIDTGAGDALAERANQFWAGEPTVACDDNFLLLASQRLRADGASDLSGSFRCQ